MRVAEDAGRLSSCVRLGVSLATGFGLCCCNVKEKLTLQIRYQKNG